MDMEVRDRILTVHLPAELDHHSADVISRETDRRVQREDIRGIVFDFRDTVFCDSSGIGMLMGRYKLMRALGGSVRGTGAGERVERILTLSGVLKIIPIESAKRQGEGKYEE
jgi:stage II sporulation protein AA (anti-sigma F factor antagonist)